MTHFQTLLVPTLWLLWLSYWLAAAVGAKRTERRESPMSRLLHLLPLTLAAWLLWARQLPWNGLQRSLIPWSPLLFWMGAAVTFAGLLFTVWARMYLVRNWSATVTLKQDHELVQGGPYALVRHPIYTGLLLGFFGSALARDEWRGVLAVLIAALALWRKFRLEERWMIERFGAAYRDYARRVPALMPSLRRTAPANRDAAAGPRKR